MSELPKPSSPKAPKQIGSHAARVKELAHDELVRFVWENLPTVVSAVFSAKKDLFDGADEAFKRFQQEAAAAAQLARSLADDVEDPLVSKALLKLAVQFAAAHSLEFSEPSPTLANTQIVVQLQSALFQSGTGQGRKQVGFVDFECNVLVPDRILCKCPVPVFLQPQPALLRRVSARSNRFPSLQEVSHTSEITPNWSIEGYTRTLMIDVRPSSVPIGLLLQELKTLRAVARDATILVVTGFFDPVLDRILENEGIKCLSRKAIQAVLNEQSASALFNPRVG